MLNIKQSTKLTLKYKYNLVAIFPYFTIDYNQVPTYNILYSFLLLLIFNHYQSVVFHVKGVM